MTLPTGALAASGRLARAGADLQLEEVAVTVGGMRAGASGIVGLQPDRAGTDLRIDLWGPDLAAAFSPVPALATLPAEALRALPRARRRDRTARLAAPLRPLGRQRLHRRPLALRLGARPGLEADLRSRRLDLSPTARQARRRARGRPDGGARSPARTPALRPAVELGYLRRLDATLRLEAGELALPRLALRDVVLAGELRTARCASIASRPRAPRGAGSPPASPSCNTYRVRAAGRIADARFGFAMKDPVPADFPSSISSSTSRARGGRCTRSPRADPAGPSWWSVPAASRARSATARGRGRCARCSRRSTRSARRRSTPSSSAASPSPSSPTARPCSILSPRAPPSSPWWAKAGIDFASEAIDLSWTLKPRQGVGISASSITNPYVKLGGSLAAPSLDLKPLSAITSMGAAMRHRRAHRRLLGLYNRITAERKVCVDALADARQQMKPAVGAGGP